jgi:hypothetical protein
MQVLANEKSFDKIRFCLDHSVTDEEFLALLVLFGYPNTATELARWKPANTVY